MFGTVKDRLKQDTRFRAHTAVGLILGVLVIAYAVVQGVKVAHSSSEPVLRLERTAWEADELVLPIVAVCPMHRRGGIRLTSTVVTIPGLTHEEDYYMGAPRLLESAGFAPYEIPFQCAVWDSQELPRWKVSNNGVSSEVFMNVTAALGGGIKLDELANRWGFDIYFRTQPIERLIGKSELESLRLTNSNSKTGWPSVFSTVDEDQVYYFALGPSVSWFVVINYFELARTAYVPLDGRTRYSWNVVSLPKMEPRPEYQAEGDVVREAPVPPDVPGDINITAYIKLAVDSFQMDKEIEVRSYDILWFIGALGGATFIAKMIFQGFSLGWVFLYGNVPRVVDSASDKDKDRGDLSTTTLSPTGLSMHQMGVNDVM